MKTQKFLISAFALAGAIVVLTTSCGKDEDPVPASLPQIGGYSSADEVASADLLAYWPLNGSGNESKSNTAPTTAVGATYEAGAKGQGLKLVDGYLAFPNITNLTRTMSGLTISAWVKVTNNQTAVADSGSASTIYSQAIPGDWRGNIVLYAETGQYRPTNMAGAINDSIKVKAGWNTIANGGQIYESWPKLESWMVADNLITPGKHVAAPNKTGGKWAQLVFTWDGSNNKFIIYSNGAKISNPAFEVRGTNTTITTDVTSTPFIGAFGNFATTPDSWNKKMTGSVDEIRIWKKTLSAADILSLYELEKAGR